MNSPVIIQRYGDHRTIWVSEGLLEGVSDAYFRKIRSQYKKGLKPSDQRSAFLPDTGKSWRWGLKNGVYYYDYNRIPNNAPKRYRDALPDEGVLLKMGIGKGLKPEVERGLIINKLRAKVDGLPINKDIMEIMNKDRFGSCGGGSYVKAEAIARKKAWLDVICEIVGGADYVRYGIESQKKFWEVLHEAIIREGNWKIRNSQSLRLRYYDYRDCKDDDERICFFLGNYTNQNRRIVGKSEIVDTDTGELMPYDVHEAVIYSLMMNEGRANKMHKRSLHEEYKKMLSGTGVVPVKLRTFNRYTESFCNKRNISLERDGFKHFNNNYLPYIKSAPLQYANTLWVADGTGSKIACLDKETGRPKSVYVVYVFDAMSKKVMGYCTGKGEKSWMVLKAFEKAFKSSGNVKPMDIVTDNSSAFKTEKKCLLRLTPRYRTITVGNSQANYAETLIRLQINSFRDCENWMYSSFHAKSIKSQANPDVVKENKNIYPSFQDVELQLMELVKRWNYTKGRDGLSPDERYALAGNNPKCEVLGSRDYRYCFGDKTEVDVSYMRGKVLVEKGDVQCSYDLPGGIMKKLGKMTGFKSDAKVAVHSDADKADIYTLSGLYICGCERTVLSHRSYAEGTENTYKGMRRQHARKREVLDEALKFKDDVNRSFEGVPYDIAAAVSNGRVKDDYNATEEMLYNEMIENTPTPKKRRLTAEEKALHDL